MKTYKILDLYCGGGGAAKGYINAGFQVVGIDIYEQTNYPGLYINAPALFYLFRHFNEFDFIHASPPCQKYSKSTAIHRNKGKRYQDIISLLRNRLLKTGKPFCIENVPTAPLRKDLILTGYMFQLPLIKKRIFEFHKILILTPGIPPKNGTVKNGDYAQVVGKGNKKGQSKDNKQFYFPGTFMEQWRYAMNIDFMTKPKELSNAIPPAYTAFIGKQVIQYLNYKNNIQNT
jgi:DNA (cytosine-5)-methyltransferase 1